MQHILIIRPGAIGDTLLTLPVIQAIREQYAPSHITLVGNAAVLPLAHASSIVDEVYDYQEARWSHLFLTESSRHSRDVRLDEILKRTQLAICWLRDPDGIVEGNLRASGIQQVRVAPGRPDPQYRSNTAASLLGEYQREDGAQDGGAQDPSLRTPPMQKSVGKGEGESGYAAAPRPSQHDLFPSCELVGVNGISLDPAKATHITTYLAETIGLTWQKPLQEISLPLPGMTRPEKRTGPIALHPGSGGARKCWPVERFAEVIDHLWQEKREVLVLAGPAEEERLVVLRRLLHAHAQPGLCEYLVDAPLLSIAERLQHCQCYIGNDAGLTHLAAMLGLPTLALFGPSDPLIWHPAGPSVTVLHAQALEELDVETVITVLASFFR